MSEPANAPGSENNEGLGQPTDIFRADSGDVAFGSIIGLLGIGLFAAFIPFFIIFKMTETKGPRPFEVGANAKAPETFESASAKYAPFIAVGWVVFMGFMVVRTMRWSSAVGKLQIWIFPKGLGIVYGPGEKVVCQWDDIASAETGMEMTNGDLIRINFLIVRKDGTKFQFSAERMGKARLLALQSIVVNEVNHRRAALLKEQVCSAEGLQVGNLKLSRDAISDGAKEIPWAEVADLKSKTTGMFSSKSMYIVQRKSNGDEISFPVDLPDVVALVLLIRDMAGIAPAQTT